MTQTWFTSDEHLGHQNIIKFCDRPFASLDEMTEKLVQNHNEVVGEHDNVYHVGDMFWRTFGLENAINLVRKRLNGNHFYVLGNHEELMLGTHPQCQILRESFVWVAERELIKPRKGVKIVLDHYAGRVWQGSGGGSIQLYGHSHGEIEQTPYGKSMDVGVDANGYYPVSLDTVLEIMEKRSLEKR